MAVVQEVVVGGGKYTFQMVDDDWRITVLRYGEPWMHIESGHKAVTSLMGALEDAEKALAEVKRELEVARGSQDGDCEDCDGEGCSLCERIQGRFEPKEV